jgi:hypothetical protein|nr:MAG TPA: hypothetical protein [Caudoviricetes sp.]
MKTELIKEVKTLIADVDKTHRYSMSKIYGLSNKVFNRNEQPQSCASCLIRKVKELKTWLDQQERLSQITEDIQAEKPKRKRKEA